MAPSGAGAPAAKGRTRLKGGRLRHLIAWAVFLLIVAFVYRPHHDPLVPPVDRDHFGAEVLGGAAPTFVDFCGIGCLPCARLEPHLNRLARRYHGRATFLRFDAGWSAANYIDYHLHTVPTLICYDRRGEVSRLVGMPAGDVDAALARFVDGSLARCESLRTLEGPGAWTGEISR